MASAVASRKRAGFSAAARQRRMGPAPFASFEQDLSDDLESPEERRAQLPGIQEDCSSPSTAPPADGTLGPATIVGCLQTPSTPRIDISRASSSSQHEEEEDGGSGASTPERELFTGQGGLGFKEEGTAELRSSTEELDYHEDATERERRRERLQRRKERGRGSMQPVFKYELEAQSEKERKDSACSLPVSGRTSRLSSVGSAASGASSGASALSVGSRAMSAISAATSRSPSPHRMLLETSFCGSKPIPTQSIDLDSPCKHETESLEKVLLSRQKDPTRVVIAVECTPSEPTPVSPSIKPASLNLAESGTKLPQSFPAVVETHPAPKNVQTPPIKPARRSIPTAEPVPNGTPAAEPIIEAAIITVTSSSQVQEVSSPKTVRHPRKIAVEETRDDRESRTPSPSTSRKSSFTNLFRRTESPLSPESPTSKRKNAFTTKLKEASDGLRERSRSRSKSGERSNSVIDGKNKKDSKNKSVFSSLFKKKSKRPGSSGSGEEMQSPLDSNTPEDSTKLTDAIGNVEFTFTSEPVVEKREIIHERVMSEDREAAEFETSEPPALPAKTTVAPVSPVEIKEVTREPAPPQHLQLEPDEANSSDSELERSRDEALSKIAAKGSHEGEVDHERKGLVLQDSFEDELPYVPTTLPQERSVAVPIVPVRQRLCPEVCAIERPRSTTPINPTNLDDFVQSGPRTGATPPPESERLRISLPREDSLNNTSRPLKSPHRKTPSVKSWAEFAEVGIQGGTESRRPSMPSPSSPPPLPPRTSPPVKSWVNFEEIPERRKAPKKIQTIPSRGPVLEAEATTSSLPYVKPEECSCCEHLDAFGLSERGAVPRRCECHGGHHGHQEVRAAKGGAVERRITAGEREQPRLEVADLAGPADRSSVMSDSSYDFSVNPYTVTEGGGGLHPMKPFGMDLDVHSNRSSVISQDEGVSPESPPQNLQ